MGYQNPTQLYYDIASLYAQDMAVARAYYEKHKLDERLTEGDLNVDARDFLPMVLLMGIQGETRTERDADICQKMEQLVKAFEDPDKEKRNHYLDLIYYLLDDFGSVFDPISMNMSDPAQVEKLLQSMLINQTVGKKKAENPEYYYKKYPTPEARAIADARNNYRMAISSNIATNLDNHNIDINIILTLPKPLVPEAREFQTLWEEFERANLEKTLAANGAVSNVQTIDFPILDDMVPLAGKNVGDIPKLSPEAKDRMHNYFHVLVENSRLQMGTKNTQGLSESGIGKSEEAVYIDGIPLREYMVQRFPKQKITDQMVADIVVTSMLNSNHKVDFVFAYRNEQGEMQYEAKTVRAAITPEQERLYMQQFSWFRRTFLNWWPFRIETLREKMERIENDPQIEERHNSIIAHQKAKIEDAFERKANREREILQENEQARARIEGYAAEKERLESSVAKWDKDSVIGILGQQITATYVLDGKELTGACAAVRKAIATTSEDGYEKMALPFAKVVLYTQLCSERAANDGQPGELEQALGIGNNIQENIENTAQNLANDPIFKDLVFKKIGENTNGKILPNRSKFERMIISGGYNGFWMEYKQNIKDKQKTKDTGKKKEKADAKAKKEKTNQKKNDAHKVMKK